MPAESWIVCRKPNPAARLRLFCLPYAGSGVSIFRTWPDGLPSDVEVCPIQLPGRGSRMAETPFTRMAPLVQALSQALRPLLDKPFAIFGHSLGAIIGFELACELRRQSGPPPVHLFVSAHRAPRIPLRDRLIHALPDGEFLDELRHLNGIPEQVLAEAELMRLMLPILRADFAVFETFRDTAGPPLDCPISAFGGLRDDRVAPADLAAWRERTAGPFARRMFPGDHFFMNTARPLLLQALSQDLGPVNCAFRADEAPSRPG